MEENAVCCWPVINKSYDCETITNTGKKNSVEKWEKKVSKPFNPCIHDSLNVFTEPMGTIILDVIRDHNETKL